MGRRGTEPDETAQQAVGEWADVPELVPVRMLNEFVYCPRLFYLEWVSQLFEDNEYTHDGRWQHRAVDVQRGRMGPAEEADPLVEARSVTLSSPRLGLVGKADIIEASDGKVVVVEVKRGKQAPTSSGLWPPEEIQVTALAMLLQDLGYTCETAEVFFATTRQRVEVPVTEEHIEAVHEALRSLRATAAKRETPPPLEDSPKCNGCSLVGICLPDETNALRFQRVEAPRRLVPADGAARPMYVTEAGSYARKSGGRIEVTKDREVLVSERLIDLSQLCLFGNVQVSSQLVAELMHRDIPICWFSYGGWLRGITEGMSSKNVELRRRQVLTIESGSVHLARRMIEGKIRNSRTLLRRNGRDLGADTLETMRRLALRAGRAETAESLLGHEGTAARIYFGQFPKMLRHAEAYPGGAFGLAGRNRRPPTDPVNCLLSFAYSLLVKDCLAVLRSVGFDPYLGVLHRPRFGRPALALDLAEEFRPLIAESAVLTMVNNGEIKPSDFVVRAGGVSLTPGGRRAALRTYERRMAATVTHPVFGYEVSYRRALEVQARILAAAVMGELDGYQPIITR